MENDPELETKMGLEVITIPKNSQEELRLCLEEYQGRPYADLRIDYRTVAGQMKLTRKGLTLSPKLWEKFMDALHQLEDQLRLAGHLDHHDQPEAA